MATDLVGPVSFKAKQEALEKKDYVKTQEEVNHLQARRELSPETKSTGAVVMAD